MKLKPLFIALSLATCLANCTTTTRVIEVTQKTERSHQPPPPPKTSPSEFKALMQYDN